MEDIPLGDLCYRTVAHNPNEIYKSEGVIQAYLPTLAFQVICVVFAARFTYYILRPLNQPRLVSEILAGFLLSEDMFGRIGTLTKIIPPKGIIAAETISHVGLIYYVFLTGLEMNIDTVLRARKKATIIAFAGTAIPMALGTGIFGLAVTWFKEAPENIAKACMIWTLVLSVTGFPNLAHILADLKLLYTGLGRVALTSAMINDFYNWVLFVLLIPFAVNKNPLYSVTCTALFGVFCFLVIRPHLVRLIVRKTDQNEWDNYQLVFVIMGAFFCATVTDLLGTHSIVGALLFGLIIPRGRFTDMLIERSDDFASGYLAPLFFASCGLRLHLFDVLKTQWPHVGLLVLLSYTTKIVSTVIATCFFRMPLRDSVALGVLMNTKGILPLIMLNIAWDKKVLSSRSFSIMVFAILIMTLVVSPIVNFIYKPRKQFEKNKLRTVQNLKSDAEIKILACVHNARHATGIINILEACNSTNVSPLRVFALQLVELKGRSTALLAAHIEQSNAQHQASGSSQAMTSQAELEGITHIFETYSEEHNQNETIKVNTLSAVSNYETIHEDIYNLAEEKQASLILLPFHKHSSAEGVLEITNTAFKEINQNVMQDAPCSVGIFVDRGLGSLLKVNLRVLMLFIGGPDDREALAIAWRMSKHQGIQLSMVRILLFGEAAEVDTLAHSEAHGLLTAVIDNEKQKELDEEYVSSFRLKAVNNEDSITYLEKEVHTAADIPEVLNELDQIGFDLYILGQGKGRDSLMLSNLLQWSDCPELGVIGDIVASNSFGSCSSVLVVQQYGFGRMVFGNNTQQSNQMPSNRSDGSEALVVKID